MLFPAMNVKRWGKEKMPITVTAVGTNFSVNHLLP
jgi:hypothetical protein